MHQPTVKFALHLEKQKEEEKTNKWNNATT